MSVDPAGGGGLPGVSVRRPMLAAVMNLLIVLAGVAAILGVEVRELPNVDRPVVSVRATFPGASPTTIDAEVTSVVEGAVARVNGVSAIRAASEQGNFRLHIEFTPSVDLIDAANDVREAVSRVEPRLPEGVRDLYVVKADADAEPVVRLAAWSSALPVDGLTQVIEDSVVPALTSVEGVAEIRVEGARERVIRVDVKPERLASYGISIGEVAEVLEAAQFDVPLGSFRADRLDVLVRADATVAEPVEIERLVLRDPVRLGDVASVYFAPAEQDEIVRLDGREVVTLGIVRQAGSNTVAISNGVGQAVETLALRFPEVSLTVIADDAVFIESAVGEVLVSLGLALVIVVGVIWLFLGSAGATLVPALAIPVSLLGSVAGIWALGFSINLVTLLALVLATGLVVDDAIVVLENIQRRRRDGMGPRAASVIGTHQVFFAVIATTVTLIAVFVPISFLPSTAGRLFREFGFALAITVGLSSFVALTLCPMLAARLPSLGGGGPALTEWLGSVLARVYAALLRPLLRAPLVTVTGGILMAATAVPVWSSIGQELVPAEDRGAVSVGLTGPEGSALAHTDRFVEAAERALRPWVERGIGEHIFSVTGQWDPNIGLVQTQLLPWDDRTVTQAEIEEEVERELQLPGASVWFRRGNSLGLSGGGTDSVSFAVTGPTHPAIAEVVSPLVDRLDAEPGLERVYMRYDATQPQISIAIDRKRASDLKVEIGDLSRTLRALIDEDEVAELSIGDKATPIMLRSAAGTILDPADLLNLYVRAETGRLVSLSQVVRLTEEGVAGELPRFAQQRGIEVRASPTGGATLDDAVSTIRAIAAEELPSGFGLVFLGEAGQLEESRMLYATFAIAFVVVFLVLAAQFESVTSALVVLATVPLGLSAAVYALWLTGTTLNIYSQIGVLMLIGIMAKNGILLVEFADQMRDRGMSAAESAYQAAIVRLRPIAMTLACTVLAGLPLILGSGAGSEAREAIGWVVFGGLGLSAAFVLLFAPAAYALIAPLARPRAREAEALAHELRQAAPDRVAAAE